jgi:hypothetical protein
MRIKSIPEEIQIQVDKIVDDFNEQIIKTKQCSYKTRYRGEYLYLDRIEHGNPNPICRLRYNGKINDWGFAIYKYSVNGYDSDEWFFPGSEYVNGTIEGAMKAALEAYP